MVVSDYSELNAEHKDTLLELGNIGTGNALTSLSQMTNHPVKMELPRIRIVNFSALPELIDRNNSTSAGVVIKVSGELECVVTFILNEVFVKIITEELTGEEVEAIDALNDMQKSAICEIGNIMCNSYLNALASMLEAEMDVSVPALHVGMCKYILDTCAQDFTDKKSEILFIENTFYYLEHEFVSYILLHPKFEALQEILKRLEG